MWTAVFIVPTATLLPPNLLRFPLALDSKTLAGLSCGWIDRSCDEEGRVTARPIPPERSRRPTLPLFNPLNLIEIEHCRKQPNVFRFLAWFHDETGVYLDLGSRFRDIKQPVNLLPDIDGFLIT
ncbi:hypothetical protein MUK42_24595 [Musa troglodytarum]|uniref:Uncharacterized protein n=1 Tax=Musa troglodytarum TaxID=320322 RepID=A0A9E7KAD3_9LILI|nr:hypothetical protein MUK42_24595 [Musa troglodytarum]